MHRIYKFPAQSVKRGRSKWLNGRVFDYKPRGYGFESRGYGFESH